MTYSESYALVGYFGEVIAKGSKARMKKLAKVLGGTIYITEKSIGEKVY